MGHNCNFCDTSVIWGRHDRRGHGEHNGRQRHLTRSLRMGQRHLGMGPWPCIEPVLSGGTTGGSGGRLAPAFAPGGRHPRPAYIRGAGERWRYRSLGSLGTKEGSFIASEVSTRLR